MIAFPVLEDSAEVVYHKLQSSMKRMVPVASGGMIAGSGGLGRCIMRDIEDLRPEVFDTGKAFDEGQYLRRYLFTWSSEEINVFDSFHLRFSLMKLPESAPVR